MYVKIHVFMRKQACMPYYHGKYYQNIKRQFFSMSPVFGLSLKRGTGNRGMERGMERGMDEIRNKTNILKILD